MAGKHLHGVSPPSTGIIIKEIQMSILRIEVKVDEKLIEVHEFDTLVNGPDSFGHFWEFIGLFQKKMAARWSYEYFFPKSCG